MAGLMSYSGQSKFLLVICLRAFCFTELCPYPHIGKGLLKYLKQQNLSTCLKKTFFLNVFFRFFLALITTGAEKLSSSFC